jgi:hypothetical protein
MRRPSAAGNAAYCDNYATLYARALEIVWEIGGGAAASTRFRPAAFMQNMPG